MATAEERALREIPRTYEEKEQLAKEQAKVAERRRGRGLVWGLAALVILLVIAIILLAVLLPKQSSSGGGSVVPNPAKPLVQGFSAHSLTGWQCPTRYRCRFQGNSYFSDASSWTPFVSPESAASPAYNDAPVLEVANSSGQVVTWQRQVGAPQNNLPKANRDGHTGWEDVVLGQVDATHFVDHTEPCGSGPRLDAPELDGWQETPEDPHIWCGTSYSVAKTDSTNVWSQWSPFFDPSLGLPGYPDPIPGAASAYPVLRVDSTSLNLIFRRRTSPDDHLGQVMQLAPMQKPTPDPTYSLWIDTNVPNCGGPGPGPTRR
jgi:hypothetical protein